MGFISLDSGRIVRSSLDSLLAVGNAEDKVDNDSQQQDDGQKSRAVAVVKSGLSPPSYRDCTPMVRDECIHHGEHRNTGKEERRDKGGSVTEVQHTNSQGAQNHGKVEP